jgi:hypothetical protein
VQFPDGAVIGIGNPATQFNACATVALVAGENRPFTVDNQKPLGGQRTIGYWKNWNSCSSSPQARTAAKTGHTLLETLLPIQLVDPLGTYLGVNLPLGNPTTGAGCKKAVAILSNASTKYAEHGLAAQLLASMLNVKNGTSCLAADTAIATGRSLLQGIKWSGAQTTQIVGEKHAQRAAFTAAAGTLDKFNNERLC